MRWHKDTRSRRGGYWRCAVRNREHSRQYRSDHPDKIRQINADRNPRRIYAGERYLASAESPEQARAIEAHLEPLISDFKTRQKEEYEKHGRFN